MRANVRATVLALVAASALVAAAGTQQEPRSNPRFDATSVKPSAPQERFQPMAFLPGRFSAASVPLRQVLLNAFRLRSFQLAGAPDWLDDRFDITATVAGNPPVDQLQAMLRTLLVDRFGLVSHREMRDLPIYVLTIARTDGRLGTDLRRSGTDCAPIRLPRGVPAPPPPPPSVGVPPSSGPRDPNDIAGTCPSVGFPGQISYRNITMLQLGNLLGLFSGRPVADRTGMDGTFDVDLVFTPDQPSGAPGGPAPPAASSDAPSIFTAVQEQLGLKLEASRGPVDVLVIEHIERPTPD
jgi:uncharacterized protein (TIGR03435 family)